jgi:hypothetical protein
MNKFLLAAVALLTGFWLLMPSALAQANPGSTNIADRVSRIILPDPAALNSPLASPDAGRPIRSERPDFSPELKSRLRSFESQRESYLAQEAQLRRQLRGATTDQDRERLRAQIVGLREELLDRARAYKEETRTRLEELKAELPKHREALDAAKEAAKDAAAHTRPRDRP